MRLWSLHPSYLDIQELFSTWKEGLLAFSVINNPETQLHNHPQLIRFKISGDPIGTLGFYLNEIFLEAKNRGFNFEGSKIESINTSISISVTLGQLDYEAMNLLNTLQERDKTKFSDLNSIFKQKDVKTHPLFYIISGPVEKWEKI